jgi:16S rRNA (guanine527-N7)-methyltransferase
MVGKSDPTDVLTQGASALGLTLDTTQQAMFRRYGEMLLDWNRRVNLTHITDPADIQRKHFLDSLTCLLALDADGALPGADAWEGRRFVDVGAGAGFPGLPVKIVLPTIRLTLLEATAKKTTFLQAVITELKLSQVEVLTGRAEEVAQRTEHRERYDAALARAVAPMATLVELTLPFLHQGGILVAQKGEDPTEEIAAASYAIDILGGALQRVSAVAVPGLDAARHLVRIEKVGTTPARYPRRSGMPKKRPLLQP